jgi:murein DD-endopeptidase MepM/ murein hydrolase activator NlpD
MYRRHWSFFVVSPTPQSHTRIIVHRLFAVVLLIAVLAAAVGFARAAWFAASYGSARIGVRSLRTQNANLQKIVRFLDKFVQTKERELESVASFESRARLKFGMNEVSEDVRKAGVGGRPKSEDLLRAVLEDPPVRRASLVLTKIEDLLRQADLQDSTFARMAHHVSSQYDLWAQRPSIWPVRGRVTSGFGYRIHPFFKRNMFHEGLDIANRLWTPVVATADGMVVEVERSGDWGNVVEIEHRSSGITTRYAHLRQATVVEGQVVKRGELVGYLGNSGRSTGPHLHYELARFGKRENPMHYILPLNAVVD